MLLRSISLCFLLCVGLSTSAQTKWGLSKCIQHAQQNSLNVKSSEFSVQDARLVQKAANQAKYPNVNASVGTGLQWGLRVDPVTNIPRSEALGYSSSSISAGMTLYNGGRIKNNIKRSGIDVRAAEADLQQTTLDISLDVAVAYLNILLAEEQLENANKRLELSMAQLDQTDKLITAGSRPAADLKDIEAQVAQDEQIVVSRKNDVDLSYLTLKQLLLLDPDKPFSISTPDLDIPEEEALSDLNLSKIYDRALSTQPGVRASELRVSSANIGIDIAKADKMPRLTAFGDLSSNYSSLIETIDQTNATLVLDDPQPVEINGIPTTLAPYRLEGFTFNKVGFFTQLKDNFGQSLGLNLSIPIYNQGITNTNIQRAEIAKMNSEMQNEIVKQQLKQDIQVAVADAKAAHKNFVAARKTEAALELAYDNTEKKYKLGASNTLEFTTAKNQWDRARVDTIIAKYQYIFKLKVVDFYQGKKLEL